MTRTFGWTSLHAPDDDSSAALPAPVANATSNYARVLLLIESANLISPDAQEPRARVLRADQVHWEAGKKSDHASASLAEAATAAPLTAEVVTKSTLNGRPANTAPQHQADFSQNVSSALPPPEEYIAPLQPKVMQRMQSFLEHGNYQVRVAGNNLATTELHQLLEGSSTPEVVILEASRDAAIVAAQCRSIKHEVFCDACSLLVVLPSAITDTNDAPGAIAQLLAAGADDFVRCDAPEYEFLARLNAMTSLARTRFDLGQTQQQLDQQLQTDDLTRLLNRRFFFQAAHREYERAHQYGHPLSCIMVDVNYFRRYSESLGYACTDAILRHVGEVLRSVTREVDIVARFSEQKFVVLLPETDLELANIISERIQRAVASSQFEWNGQALPVTVSVGEAERRLDAAKSEEAKLEAESEESDEQKQDSLSLREEVAEMLEEADAALFVAKRGVRNNDLRESRLASSLHEADGGSIPFRRRRSDGLERR